LRRFPSSAIASTRGRSARLGGDGGAFERIERDVDAGAVPCAEPTFSPMKSIGASSRSPSPMTTVPSELELVERVAHRFDGGMIGRLFIAAPDQLRGRDRRGFGHPDHFQNEYAVEGVACSHHGIGHPVFRGCGAD
jgi:hypothetical protein